jgi:molybdopterin-guanine dinucleotide biosynthesis protein A
VATERPRPVVLVTGAKDCGKTTLVVDLIRRLTRPGRGVVALKRASTVVRVDQPGADTARFAAAGAAVIGLTWPGGTYVSLRDGTAQPKELAGPASLPDLVEMAESLGPHLCGSEVLVLAEGFSDTPYPRIHVQSRPGHPVRAAAGPVLGTWRLDEGCAATSRDRSVGGLAALIETMLPLLGSWAEEACSGKPGALGAVAAVLTGGQGRRLGGLDKWTISVGGRLQSDWCLGALTPLFDTVLLVGRTPGRSVGDRPACLSTPRALQDIVPASGPLGGLLTALSASGGRMVVAFAGDMPLINPNFVRHLLFLAARHAGRFDVLLPRWGGGGIGAASPGFAEPLHAVYGPGCLEHLAALLRTAGSLASFRMVDALRDLRIHAVPEQEIRLFGDPAEMFLNLNTAEDLVRAERILSTTLAGTTTHLPK